MQGWGLSGGQGCWGQVGWVSGSVEWGQWRPGQGGDRRSGCAAGAGSAESAAGAPASLHTSAVPCGRTDGQPAAAASGTPKPPSHGP